MNSYFSKILQGCQVVGETGAMWALFVFPLLNFFKDKLRKNKSIGLIPCYLFMFGNFLNFFLNVSVSYSIKCKEKKTGLNGTEAGAGIFLCNG
jgi:hypothetical protein